MYGYKSFEEREVILQLRKMLLITEANLLNGTKSFTASEVENRIRS